MARTIPRLTAVAILAFAIASTSGAAAGPDDPAPLGGVEGVVVADGKPVAGATVVLRRGVSLPRSIGDAEQVARGLALLDDASREEPIAGTATTDERGRFVFADVERSAYAIEATASGAAGALVGFAAPVEVEESRWVFAAVSVSTPRRLSGRVLELPGRPVRGRVLLSLAADGGAVHPHAVVRSVEATEEGAFTFAGIPNASYELTVARPGLRILTTVNELLPDGSSSPWIVPAFPSRVVHVHRADGKPVADAAVVTDAVEFERHRVLAGGHTDAKGSIALAIPEGVWGILRVAAPGFSATSFRFEKGQEPIDVAIDGATALGRVVGRVLDPDGRPVAGAAVHVHQATGAFLVEASPSPATSGADGHFVIEDVEPGPVWLAAIGAGFISQRLSDPSQPPRPSEIVVVPPGGEATSDVRVVPAAKVAGIVQNEDGKPVPGAFVRWRTRSETVSHSSEWAPPAERVLVSGADGRFEVPTLAPRTTVVISASAAGLVDDASVVELGAARAKASEAVVILAKSRTFVVRVRDAATRAPIAGAQIELRPGDGGMGEADIFHRAQPTGADGNLVVGGLSRGRLIVHATHAQFLATPDVTVTEPGDATLDVVMRLGLEISGVVRDAAGRPVAKSSVSGEPEGARGSSGVGPSRSSWTDDAGRFRLTGLASGSWRLSVYVSGVTAETLAQAGTENAVIVLPGEAKDRGPVVVHVVGPDGKPVPLANIEWTNGRGGSGSGYVSNGTKELEWDDGVSDLEGWTIDVFGATDAKGVALPFGHAKVGPLPAGDRRIELKLPPGRAVSGRVVGPAGEPIVGVEVAAFEADPRRAPTSLAGAESKGRDAPRRLGSAPSALDGTFSIWNLGDDAVLLVVHSRDPRATLGLVAPVAAAAGATGVAISLVARRSAVISVLDESGAPLGGLSVVADRDVLGQLERVRARTDEQGHATLEGLVIGAPYQLEVKRPRAGDFLVVWSKPNWLPADETARVGEDPVARGIVRDREGRPYGVALLMGTIDEPAGIGFSVPDGSFEIAVPTGNGAMVRAWPPFNLWASGFVDPELASPETRVHVGDRGVTLIVDRGVAMTMRVDSEDASAWKDVQPLLTREESPWDAKSASGLVWRDDDSRAAPLPPLPPLKVGARYRLWLPVGTTGRCALESFVATEGGVVVLRPVAGASLTGTAQRPAGGSWRAAFANGEGFFAKAFVGDDGAFTFTGLPPNRAVDVVVEADVGDVHWTGHASATPGTPGAPVTIELKPPPPK
jgi:hypothetical protein